MARTVLSSDTITDSAKRTALIDAVDKAVTVDRQLDLLNLASQLQGVSSGSIAFHTIPIVSASYDTAEDGEAVQVDPQKVQEYISETASGSTDATAAPKAGGSSSGGSSGGSSPGSVSPKTSAGPAVPAEDAGTAAPTVPCVN